MENPGEYLKREREHREVPLSKIAESTRVPIKFLEALEADDHDALPHPTFVKGYIKSYCKVLGLDETDAVLRYELYLREKPGRTEDEEAAGEAGKNPLHRLSPSRMSEGATSSGSGPFSAGYIVTAAVVLVAVAIVYYYTQSSKRTAVPPEQAQTVSPEASVDNGPAPQAPPALPANGEAALKPADGLAGGARPAEEAASARAAAPGEKHTLTASAAEISWIKVVIDDEDPFDVVLREGEKVSWKADRAFHLVVGNAGGVTIDFDGERLSGLGSSGEVVTLTLPKDAVAPKAKKPVSPRPKTPPATIAPGADISPSTDASLTAPSPRPAVKKTTQASAPSPATGAEGSGTAETQPTDAGAATAPRWDSKSQEKFDVRPADVTAE
jgi:cytoskeletal protein RodZ